MPSDNILLVGGIAIVVAAVFLLRRQPATADAQVPVDQPDLTIPPPDRPLYNPTALSMPQRLIANKIIQAAWLAGLNPAFMLALALTESSLRPTIKGDDGLSLGLFQLQLATARDHRPDITEEDLLTTDTNIAIAMAEMKRLMRVYPGFTYGDYAEAWTLGGRGRFVRGRRNMLKITRMHAAITDLELDLFLTEVAA